MLQKLKPYTAIIGLGSTVIISGILGYIFHPVMVRYLSDADFVHLQFLMSLMNILAVVGGVSLFVTQEMLQFAGDEEKEASFFHVLLIRFQRAVPWILIVCVLIAIFLSQAFPITNFPIVLFSSLAIVSSVFGAILIGMVRARRNYALINYLNVGGAFLKLLFAGTFVYIGWQIWGAITGVVISGVTMVLILYYIMSTTYRSVDLNTGFIERIQGDLKDYIRPLLHTTSVVFLVTLLINLDIFLISKVLDTADAAIYSSLSLVAKFVFFICAAIEVYFYNNIVSSTQMSPQNLLRPLLVYAVMLVGGLGGIYILGAFVLDIFKPGLAASLEFLPMLYIFFLVVGVVSMYSKVLIARKQHQILWFMLSIVLFMSIYMLVFVQSISDMMGLLLYTGILLLLSIGICVYSGFQKFYK